MKQIIDNALNETGYDQRTESDLIKLRLRGRGSGFKEGPAKRESDEPLHLCVSAKYHEIYTNACKYVENLLSRIYEEYKDHNKNSCIYPDSEMAIKKIECFNNPKIDQNNMQDLS